jgi:hypothetical protein
MRAWLELVYAYGSDPYAREGVGVRISPRARSEAGGHGRPGLRVPGGSHVPAHSMESEPDGRPGFAANECAL